MSGFDLATTHCAGRAVSAPATLSRTVCDGLAMQAGTAGPPAVPTSPGGGRQGNSNGNGNDPRASAWAVREPNSPDEAMPAPAQTGITQKDGPRMAGRRITPMTIATTPARRQAWPARDRALLLWHPHLTIHMIQRVRERAPAWPLIPHPATTQATQRVQAVPA